MKSAGTAAFTIYLPKLLHKRLTCWAAWKGVPMARIVRNILCAVDWCHRDYEHLILEVPRTLLSDPEKLRLELHKLADRVADELDR
jgi:hypothetical protein